VFLIVLAGRSWLALAHARAGPQDDAQSRRWLRGWNIGTLA
jgi:hypothetical protein